MSILNHALSGTSPHSLPAEITAMLILSSISAPSATTTDPTESVSLATAVASSLVATAEDGSSSGATGGECSLLGEASIFIQGALGGLALLSLVYKRWRERPQRPLKVWFFDVSKQVVGSVLLHIANLLMSMLSSGHLTVTPKTDNGEYKANPCSFYLLNLAIDVGFIAPIIGWVIEC